MHQSTYLLVAFTIVLCLAALVIIALNKRVNTLQKENTRLGSKLNGSRSPGKANNLKGTEPRWQQVEPLKVAKQVYDSGITSLN